MFTFISPDGCEGCEDRKEIMGAGAWQVDAFAVGVGFALIILVIYLSK